MSVWKKSPFRAQHDLRDRYPILQELLDPWGGDEAFYPLEDKEFMLALHESSRLEQYLLQSARKGHKKQLIHDGSRLNPTSELCSEIFLANLTEDWIPDIGLFGQERVLGPFAPYPAWKILCGAILCFSPLLKHGVTPAGRFVDTQKSNHTLSLGLQAKTPCMLWKQKDQCVEPLLPLATHYRPTGKIHKLPNQTCFVARISPLQAGWTASCVLPVPEIETKYLYNRLLLEWLKLQRSNARIFWEDILRYRSELIYRSILEYCYIYQYKETISCWESYFSRATTES